MYKLSVVDCVRELPSVCLEVPLYKCAAICQIVDQKALIHFNSLAARVDEVPCRLYRVYDFLRDVYVDRAYIYKSRDMRYPVWRIRFMRADIVVDDTLSHFCCKLNKEVYHA